jgi:hypothetical protein
MGRPCRVDVHRLNFIYNRLVAELTSQVSGLPLRHIRQVVLIIVDYLGCNCPVAFARI